MSVVKIDFSELRAAAKEASKTAGALEDYADRIPDKVQSPLSSLTGGSSSNTSSAASLAMQKARSLRERAGDYERLAKKVSYFAVSAETTDKRVANAFRTVKDIYKADLTTWQKFGLLVSEIWNSTLGKTPWGRAITMAASCLEVAFETVGWAFDRVHEFFKDGGGKYILSKGLALLGAVGAIAGAVTSSGVLAVLGVVAAVVAVAVAVVVIMDAEKACAYKRQGEPGIARYYGSTSSLEDWAKKNTTDKSVQEFARTADITGALAGIISSGIKMFTSGGSLVGKEALKGNLLKQLGLETVDGSLQFKGSVFGWGKTVTEGAPKWFQVAETMQNTTDSIKAMGNTIQTIVSWDSGASFTQNTFKMLDTVSNMMGVEGSKDVSEVIKFADKYVIDDFYTKIDRAVMSPLFTVAR